MPVDENDQQAKSQAEKIRNTLSDLTLDDYGASFLTSNRPTASRSLPSTRTADGAIVLRDALID